MQRERQDAGPLGGREDGEAVGAGGVERELAGPPRAGLREARDEPGEGVVGDGEDHEVAGGDHLVGVEQRNAGQQAGGALGGGGGEAGRGDVVTRGCEGCAQDGADPAGADDAHAEAGGGGGGREKSGSADGPAGSRHRCTSRSSPDRVPDVGCGPHRRDRSVRAVSLWCGPAGWRRPAAAGCVARIDRRWRGV